MVARDILRQQLPHTLVETNYKDQGELYRGKVRDNYIKEETITMVTTDRISAFDRVLGTVPFKGQALVEMADWWFGETADIVANHVLRRPHPNVWTVRRCDPIQVEMVVRGYLTGITPRCRSPRRHTGRALKGGCATRGRRRNSDRRRTP